MRMCSVLSKRQFSVMRHTGLGSDLLPPVLVHVNHLIGWKLNGTASPLYVHTIPELCRLSASEARTLDTSRCFLSCRYYEWDNWRELIWEPGWSMHITDEPTLEAIVQGSLLMEEISSRAEPVSIEEGL